MSPSTDRERYAHLYHMGLSLRSIARTFGTTLERVRKGLVAQGVAIRPGGRRLPPEEEAELLRLYRSGLSVRQIARLTGHAITCLYKVVKRSARPKAARPDRRGEFTGVITVIRP